MGEERGWWHGHLLREKDEVRSLSDMESAMATVENGREIQLNHKKFMIVSIGKVDFYSSTVYVAKEFVV